MRQRWEAKKTWTRCVSSRAPEGFCFGSMDPQVVSGDRFEVDVDLGFALFFFLLLCFFLLATIVRCAHLVLDPYSSVSVSTYQEEDTEE